MITRIPSPFIMRFIASVFAFVVLATGCVTAPPVQEMSDARQAIRAASDAEADKHAPQSLRAAESLMDTAARDLEQGQYEQARRAAVAAREKAIKARDEALIAHDQE